ncbi:tripartite tricarboxylate transporter substrate binding protein [Alcaligenaceae bacterium SAGV3]|nr:tripartite tricarboxylate transporter substrate binding protein [Alcaligenaceae bacterium SAGV3]
MSMKIRILFRCALAALWLGLAGVQPAWAQAYPDRPVRLLMSFSAGSGVDTFGRLVAQKLADRLGGSTYVENKGGAGGIIGIGAMAKAMPDGYTIGLIANTATIHQGMRTDLPFDLKEDFAYITLLARGAMVLAVRKDLPAQTLPELVALAKARPGQLNYGTPGIATPHHLATELLKHETGMDVLHVPHKGAVEAINGLNNGSVDFELIAIQSALPHLKSGRIRALAVTTASRQPVLKDVPTVAEAIGAGGGGQPRLPAWAEPVRPAPARTAAGARASAPATPARAGPLPDGRQDGPPRRPAARAAIRRRRRRADRLR